MNPWKILNIDSNSNLKEIKKAYAKLLKTNHPEDNPEGYQKLREAYDLAIKLTKNSKNYNQELILSSSTHDNESEIIKTEKQFNFNHNIFNNYSLESSTSTDEYNEFLYKLDSIYNNPKLRFKKEVWQELFSAPILWNLEYASKLYKEVFKYLIDHHYIPKEIWDIIDYNFSYSDKINTYPLDKWEHDAIINLLDNINLFSKLNYTYLDNIDEDSLDKYIDYRHNVYICIKSRYWVRIKKYLDLAYEIYKGDPELYRLEGDYYFELNDYEKAASLYSKAISINSEDYFSLDRLNQLISYNKIQTNIKSSFKHNEINYSNSSKVPNKKPKMNYKVQAIVLCVFFAIVTQLTYKHISDSASNSRDKKLESTVDVLNKSLDNLNDDLKNSYGNSELSIKLSNANELPFYISNDDSGNQVYLTLEEFASNKNKDKAKKFYSAETESGIVMLFACDISKKIYNDGDTYLTGKLVEFPNKLSSSMEKKLNELYAQNSFKIIFDRYLDVT